MKETLQLLMGAVLISAIIFFCTRKEKRMEDRIIISRGDSALIYQKTSEFFTKDKNK